MPLSVLGKADILGQSQHYAGTAFDVAQGWTNARRAALRTSAINSGVWSYVEPVTISPTFAGAFITVIGPFTVSILFPALSTVKMCK